MSKEQAKLGITRVALVCTCEKTSYRSVHGNGKMAKVSCYHCGIEWQIPRWTEVRKTANQINKELGF